MLRASPHRLHSRPDRLRWVRPPDRQSPDLVGGNFITSGDARLAYSLDLPQGAGPFPAVVAGHGSGRVTRQQMEGFAARWTAMGFAVLRFDKRGVGESTGVYSEVGALASSTMIPLLASDIAAAARFLRGRPEIDSRRVGLAGASQAGWILPHAARDLGGVPFMVLLSGPVCTVGLENFYSTSGRRHQPSARRGLRPAPELFRSGRVRSLAGASGDRNADALAARRGGPQHSSPHDCCEPDDALYLRKAVRVEDVSGPRPRTLVSRMGRHRRLGPPFSHVVVQPFRAAHRKDVQPFRAVGAPVRSRPRPNPSSLSLSNRVPHVVQR